MEQYGELRELTRRFYEAVARGDEAFLKRLVSRREGALFIGTDANEWWEGSESFLRAMRAQAEALGGNLHIVPGQLQAYREGTLGWVVDRGPTLRLPNGTEVPCRHTLVFPAVIPSSSIRSTASGSSSTSTPPLGSGTRRGSGRTAPRRGPHEPSRFLAAAESGISLIAARASKRHSRIGARSRGAQRACGAVA